MFCVNCGKELPDDAKFCLSCGKPQKPTLQQALSSESAFESPVRRLACPSCGGMLPLPDGDAEFMKCSYCQTTLQIRRSANRVILVEDPWETCEIKSVSIRSFEALYSSPFRFQVYSSPFRFQAEAVGPQGMYTAALSPSVNCDSDAFANCSDQDEKVTRDSLDWLVRTLYEEGWESVHTGMKGWYDHKFRRRIHDPKVCEWCYIGLDKVQKGIFFRPAQGRFFAQIMNGPNKNKQVVVSPSEVKVNKEKDKPLLDALVETLEQDGWEYLHNGPDWWTKVFRRPLR